MYRVLALLITYVFQPLLMPTLVVALLLFKGIQPPQFNTTTNLILVFLVFLTTFIIPALSLITLKLTKNISSLHMKEREDRLLPFGMVSAFFLLSTYLFSTKQELDPIIVLAMFLVTACIILLTVATMFIKISAHMMGVSGLLGFTLFVLIKQPETQLLPLFLCALVLTGAVGSSRLYLNAHSPREILWGFLVGFSVCFGGMMYWM